MHSERSLPETNFAPATMVPHVRAAGTRTGAAPTPKVEIPSQPYLLPDPSATVSQRMTASPYDRLHASPTKYLSQRNMSLIPDHLLTGALPDAGHKISSSDFFTEKQAAKGSRPSTTPARGPLHFAHEYSQVRAPPPGALEAYRGGSAAGPSPLKIVKHGCDQVALAKGSPEKCPRGVSRNVLGGYYTT